MGRFSFVSAVYISLMTACLIWLRPAVAAGDKDLECGDPTAWSGFTRIVLKESSVGSADVVEWKVSFDHGTNDILIYTDAHGQNTSINGSIAMVGGRIMLSKGLELEPGYEIDALDAPILNIKLLMILLGRAFPTGPAEVAGQTKVDISDNTGIKYTTPSASGYIPAPWTVQGNAHKLAQDQVIFDLTLTFPVKKKDNNSEHYSLLLSGELSMLPNPVFLDNDTLDGWKLYGVGPRRIEQAGSTILDYGATPEQGSSYRTIGDLRVFIAAENHPGDEDPSKNFTGFWKQKCEQAFGLQIMHQGNDGKYSVVFCGPGGCGDPSESRYTFITGDKQWQVVSEDELIQVGQAGERQTYHRCTKETNPVLKYK